MARVDKALAEKIVGQLHKDKGTFGVIGRVLTWMQFFRAGIINASVNGLYAYLHRLYACLPEKRFRMPAPCAEPPFVKP